MTIDEAINTINNHSMLFASSDEEAINAIQFLMDVAKKYKKIRLIINKWNAGIYDDEGLCDVEVLEMLSDEVLEDGNNN